MQTYSEFYNGNRTATVTLVDRHWNPSFNKWEVSMYEDGKIIERRTVNSESMAENMAEDFVYAGGSGPSILLNEGK